MPVESPMSNFNRKNPYVILAKMNYDTLMGTYEKISKELIITWICISIVFGSTFIISIIYKDILSISYSLIYLVMSICITVYMIRNTIKDPVNNDIDKMVSLSNAEILKINEEFVQKTIYKLHETIGKSRAYIYLYAIYVVSMSIYTLLFFIGRMF